MEDMMARIVEMDKKARGLTDEAQQSKLNYEKEILLAKEKIKTDYLARARERIRINRQSAEKKADEQLAQIEKKNAQITAQLDECDRQHHDEWVRAIVERVTAP